MNSQGFAYRKWILIRKTPAPQIHFNCALVMGNYLQNKRRWLVTKDIINVLNNGIFDGIMVFMNATVEIDKAGRIVVPKKLRDDLHLVPGTRLRIERSGDRLVFEPAISEPQLIMKDGMWVVSGGQITVEDVNELIRQGYAERQARNTGRQRAGVKSVF